MTFPKQAEVVIPLISTLASLGGSAKPRDVYQAVAKHFPQLTESDMEERMESSPSTRKWWNLVQWVRQKLVESGEIDGSIRGVWKLTEKGANRLVSADAAHDPVATAQAGYKKETVIQIAEANLRDLANQSRDEAKRRLLAELKQLSPQAFESFCKGLLEQLGYQELAVTKMSGDGGVDGFGTFRQGAVSIKSAFQAKRWTETPVGRPDIDKFRGAIQGDFDHGVFLTTSRFSKDAESASYKKGAISILLLDGQAIAEIMIDRGIGVNREPVYVYEVSSEYFEFD